MCNLKHQFLRFSTVLLLAYLVSSCQYVYIEVEELDPEIPVRFSESILPIFIENKCITCHQSSISTLDLTAEKAYKTIVPLLIDSLNPELSIIYTTPNPSSPDHQFKKYTPEQAIKILMWIKQGAINN